GELLNPKIHQQTTLSFLLYLFRKSHGNLKISLSQDWKLSFDVLNFVNYGSYNSDSIFVKKMKSTVESVILKEDLAIANS
ncbi:hypothetical protein, partial [Klebsiella pneumoniae]|uniref:hypothetical protein n=1 Tax=Klebsiella pneumoniae TaxID=573 RepID=UPI0039C42157